MKITYWSDYMCPFCYIGEANLMKALEKTGLTDKVELEMKAYQLNPNADKYTMKSAAERMAKKYGMPIEKAEARVEHIDRLGRLAGLDMRMDRSVGANTFDALRLTKYAESLGDEKVADKLVGLLFKAVFTDGLCVSDHGVLAKLAAEAGIKDEAAVRKVLNTDAFAGEVSADEREALQRGVHGVPYYIVGETVMSGAYPVEEMEKILQQVYDDERSAASMPQGSTCGKHGCKVAG